MRERDSERKSETEHIASKMLTSERMEDVDTAGQRPIFSEGFRIFPVPAQQQVTMVVPDEYVNSGCTIFTSTGSHVRSLLLNNTINHLDTSDLPSGIYFIAIASTDQAPVVLKVVVQK